jgi:hypothetical protein
MADGGAIAAAFRALAEDAAQAGEGIGSSVAKWTEDTADIEDENVSRTLAADAENTRAVTAIRPESEGLPEGGGGPSKIAQILGGDGAGDTAGTGAGLTDASLTDADRVALHDYTTNDGYMTMNPFLRNPDGYSAEEQAAIQARADRVSAGLAKLPPRPGTTYRGVNFPDEVLQKYEPGTVVTEKAFTSTSTDPAVATGNFNGNALMLITGQSGHDIAPFSDYPESEILYDKGTQFQVIGRSFNPATGKVVIQMREVG